MQYRTGSLEPVLGTEIVEPVLSTGSIDIFETPIFLEKHAEKQDFEYPLYPFH